jgi:hypothetical protein
VAWEAGEAVQGDLTVTHVGEFDTPKITSGWERTLWRFRCRPRPAVPGGRDAEDYVSVYVGRLTLDEAAERLTGGQTLVARPTEAVRYTKVQTLVAAGFDVTYEPDMWEEHAAVRYEEEWNDDRAKLFVACFREHLR